MLVIILLMATTALFKGVTPDQVYYCGGALMQKILTKLCRKVGAKFYPEDFDAGTTFVQSIEEYFPYARRKQRAQC